MQRNESARSRGPTLHRGYDMKEHAPRPARSKSNEPVATSVHQRRQLGERAARGQGQHDPEALATLAIRPAQAKRAVDAGYDDLVATARSGAPDGSGAAVATAPGGPDMTGMPAPVRAKMEGALGADFSGVRVYPNSARAAELGAQAFTQGEAIHVAPGKWAPETAKGQELLGHELGHVVQQRAGRVQATAQLRGVALNDEPTLEAEADAMGARAARAGVVPQRASLASRALASESIVQRRITPEDVSSEMGGKVFEVTKLHTAGATTLKPGDQVTIMTWDNASELVTVLFARTMALGAFSPSFPVLLDVPKKLLRPARTAVAGVAPYSAGVSKQAGAVEKAETKVADWDAKKGDYTTPKGVALWTAEKSRLDGSLAKKREVLNRKLIQETMFNRFDAAIQREVAAANAAHGFVGKDSLDPNLVKSMLFQESQLGTSGTHLEVPPSVPEKSRYNLGQVIDSSGMALLTLLEREKPAIIAAFLLSSIRADLATAQARRTTLKKKPSLTAAETTELAALDHKAAQSWEIFIWEYKATGSPVGFEDAVNAFYASSSPVQNLDYDFWIHIAVLWLFEKKKAGKTWPDAIQAYNGSGARAIHYRDAVTKRASGAAASAKAGTPFVPSGI